MISFTAQDWYNLLNDPKGFVVTIAPPANTHEIDKRNRPHRKLKPDQPTGHHPYGYTMQCAREFIAQDALSLTGFAQARDIIPARLREAVKWAKRTDRKRRYCK